jgi:hypothetical protein
MRPELPGYCPGGAQRPRRPRHAAAASTPPTSLICPYTTYCSSPTVTTASTISFSSATAAAPASATVCLRHYFRFYLHVRNGHELVPFAAASSSSTWLMPGLSATSTSWIGSESTRQTSARSSIMVWPMLSLAPTSTWPPLAAE